MVPIEMRMIAKTSLLFILSFRITADIIALNMIEIALEQPKNI